MFEGSGRAILGTANADTFDFTPFTSVTGVPSIQGRGGNKGITGSHGADTIPGGTGVDRIDDNSGADTVSGNAGNDNFFVTAATSAGLLTVTDFDCASNGGDLLHLITFTFGSATRPR